MTRQTRTTKPNKSGGTTRAKSSPRAEQQSSEHTEREAPQGTTSSSASTGGQDRQPFLQSDQLSATLTKGLDLAEASLSLGLTLMTRLGSMVQESVLEKMGEAVSSATAQAQPERGTNQAEPATPSTEPPADEPARPPDQDVAYGITNRLPLFPGHPVTVSFSINNDSETVAKRVKLKVEGFVGQISAVHVPASGFSIKPGAVAIAPMDFEKFVLKGTLPSDIPSDVYLGKVVVVADHHLEIPVRLVVGPPTP